MDKRVKRAYKYRFYPDPYQERQLSKTLGCARFVWNRALAARRDAYESGSPLSGADVSALLPQWKADPELEFLKEPSSVALQQSLQNLDRAYQNFFAKRARFPRFKSRRSRNSFTLVRTGFRFWHDEDGDPHLQIAKLKQELSVTWHREVPDSNPSRATISRDSAGRWFVSLLFEEVIDPTPGTGVMAGIDLGIGDAFAIVHDGETTEKIENPRHYRKLERKLARAQKRLSRKEKGSKNREKARANVARINARIRDARADFLHKLSSRLIDENQILVVETLNVAGMKRNRGLAKSVSDAGMGEFLAMLQYKADRHDRRVIAIDRWFPSSQLCSNCLKQYRELALSKREWTCSACQVPHDRDENAAKNLRAAGTAVLACGEDVSLGDLIAYMRSESKADLDEAGIRTEAVA